MVQRRRLPAIRVQGRAGDTLFDRTPGGELFQIEQTAPATPRVRLLLATGAEPDRLLAASKLDSVTIERAEEPARQEPGGGKYRTIIPLG